MNMSNDETLDQKIVEVAKIILSVSAVSYDEATNERREMARAAAAKVIAALPTEAPEPVTREAVIAAMSVELEKSGKFDTVNALVWATRLYDARPATEPSGRAVARWGHTFRRSLYP